MVESPEKCHLIGSLHSRLQWSLFYENRFFCFVVVVMHHVEVGQAADNMKAFPPADEGMSRLVLQLPEQADETLFKVELLLGKTIQTDEQNRYFFGGKIEEETIQGLGFSRFVVKELGPMAGTLIGIDPKTPKVSRFITLGGEPFPVRYNSRLPLVVYVPDGVEVRYQLWKAEPDAKVMETFANFEFRHQFAEASVLISLVGCWQRIHVS